VSRHIRVEQSAKAHTVSTAPMIKPIETRPSAPARSDWAWKPPDRRRVLQRGTRWSASGSWTNGRSMPRRRRVGRY